MVYLDRITMSFLVVGVLCLSGCGETLYAYFHPNWFQSTDTVVAQRIGLHEICVQTQQASSECTNLLFSNIDRGGLCEIDGKELENRFITMRIGVIVGVALGAITFGLSFLALVVRKMAFFAVLVLVPMMACVASALTVGYFFHTFEQFMYCENNYCDWFVVAFQSIPGPKDCFYFYGYPFSLMCAGCLSFFLAGVWAAFTCAAWVHKRSTLAALEKRRALRSAAAGSGTNPGKGERAGAIDGEDNEPYGSNPPTNPLPPRGGGKSTAVQPQQLQEEQEEEVQYDAEDYEYDDSTGLYYSETTQLYWDEDSDHYYNAVRNEWYDPVAGSWYSNDWDLGIETGSSKKKTR